MKRIVLMLGAVLGLALSASTSHAGWNHMFYSGYQPWWNVFAKRYKCMTPEEERLQKFWHDYYDAMQTFYKGMDRIDWVAYYKNHGYQINGGAGCGAGGCGRINYAPVFVTPGMQWAVPASMAGGPPVAPPYMNVGYNPGYGGYPQFPGYGPGAGVGPIPTNMPVPQDQPVGVPGGNFAPIGVPAGNPGVPAGNGTVLPPPVGGGR